MNAHQARDKARSIASDLIRQYLAREGEMQGVPDRESEAMVEKELERLAQRLDD